MTRSILRARNPGGYARPTGGVGIPSAWIRCDIVFDPFTRVSKAHIASGDSCGLGLSIVNALVALHGGVLTLESEKGVGTTARVALPMEGRGGMAVARLP